MGETVGGNAVSFSALVAKPAKSEKCGCRSWFRTNTMPPEQPLEAAFPMIHPTTAALYFDDIEGFGEWPILLSTRALKALREVERADGAMFQIVLKKIKWDPSLHCYGYF